MYTKRMIMDRAATFPGTCADTPFENDFETTVLRHSDTGKWFGIIMTAPCARVGLSGDGATEILNLKCDPLVSFGLFDTYAGIMPAYHMNKHHWITIRLEDDIPGDIMDLLMKMSYDLTMAKPAKRHVRPRRKERRQI